MFSKKNLGGAALTALMLAAPAAVHAQTTTGSVRAFVSDEAGAPVSDATVTITHVPTGAEKVETTTGAGFIFESGLRVGGPYRITATAPGYDTQVLDGLSVDLGQTLDVSVVMTGGVADELIVVTASSSVQTAIGPSAVFNSETLQNLPAINRDIRDVIQTDPRIYLDQGFVEAPQCAGANPRFNSLTLDGIRFNDSFGLNSTGYPTERAPFSFDAIEQVAVELAPFDVQYGGFTACNINAVTRSGTNEFHGSLFYDYTDDGLTGDSLEGDDITIQPFEQKRYGFTIGGPIIPDRLFFFGAYEKFEGANVYSRGPEGTAVATEVEGFTQADFERVRDIAINTYDYDPGEIPGSFPNEDEKITLRLDWNITNDHRAVFAYNYNDGFNIVQSDGDSDEFEYSNHLYERGAELNSYTAQLFSDWTDNFSTELSFSKIELDNRQISVGGTAFGEVQIFHNSNTIYLGADDSRHANDLNYDNFRYKAAGQYVLGSHVITGGWEREELDIFNLFVQENQGEYRFNSIDDFEAGIYNRITYENAPSLNVNDAAASFSYAIDTLYLQDEWSVTPDLTLTYGLRYDRYSSDDKPPQNDAFEALYGFTNTENVDGLDLLQPRFGFKWDVSDELSLRGGFGLYSGGNPNVWVSNNYSNNGVIQVEFQDRNPSGGSLFDLTYVMDEDGLGRPIYGIPSNLAAQVQGATNNASSFGVNAMDPSFEIPKEWKFALGATYYLDTGVDSIVGGEYVLNFDYLYSRSENPATIQNIGITLEDTGPAGFPYYSDTLGEAYVLTNADEEASSAGFAISLSKDYHNGIDWTFGYAYSDAEDVNPMTSSVAFSNFNNGAYLDPNDRPAATSNYNIPHRFTFVANFAKAFFGDYETRASIFAQANEGRPFSYTFSSNSVQDFFQGADSSLLYVPTGIDDPNVVFAPTFDTAAFFDFVNAEGLSGYAGGFTERNSADSDWFAKVDLRLEQEFPGALPGHSTSAFLVIENFGNLLNDEWGVFREQSFPRLADVVSGSYDADTNQFTYDTFSAPRQSRSATASLYEIRFGVKYDF